MTAIDEIAMSPEAFDLGAVLAGAVGDEVRLARALPTGTGMVGYFWVDFADLVAVEEALSEAPEVRSFGVVDTVDGKAQFRVERTPRRTGFLETLWRAGGVLLDAVGDEEGWTVRVGFDSSADRTAFLETCDKAGRLEEPPERPGTTTDATGVTGVTESALHRAGLTLVQRETLRSALESGYFDVPRRITLAEIAREKEVSDNAVSQRLRRGLRIVLRAVLEGSGEGGSEPDGLSESDRVPGDGTRHSDRDA